MDNSSVGAWILGIVMGVLALLGMAMASAAVDSVFYGTGLLISAFGIVFVFILIKQNTG